jgi:hypothetical protein
LDREKGGLSNDRCRLRKAHFAFGGVGSHGTDPCCFHCEKCGWVIVLRLV